MTEKIIDEIDLTAQSIGRLSSIVDMLDLAREESVQIESFIAEIMASNEIEGEYLNQDSVRSSVRKRLDASFALGEDSSTHHTDALMALLLDSNLNHKPLTIERLHQWHGSLFAGGYSLLAEGIRVGRFRDYDDMEVVSGAYGKEKIHYRAVPHKQIVEDISSLLEYVNRSSENVYIKSAKAHIWFLSIHPYDDGNGRIARVIADYILSKEMGLGVKYFSISSAINVDKKSYYEILEQSQSLLYNREYDFSLWIAWHIKTLRSSIEQSLQRVSIVTRRAKFWKTHEMEELNNRQLKVLNRLLEVGQEGFEGGLSTKKYMGMTKVSKPTAIRDIKELVAHGYLQQIEGTAGRNVKYEIVDRNEK
jgi:Fic family protein